MDVELECPRHDVLMATQTSAGLQMLDSNVVKVAPKGIRA